MQTPETYGLGAGQKQSLRPQRDSLGSQQMNKAGLESNQVAGPKGEEALDAHKWSRSGSRAGGRQDSKMLWRMIRHETVTIPVGVSKGWTTLNSLEAKQTGGTGS